ncbi:hypothetical protein ACX3YG_13200 [Pseudomonas wadenswilerensis]
MELHDAGGSMSQGAFMPGIGQPDDSVMTALVTEESWRDVRVIVAIQRELETG